MGLTMKKRRSEATQFVDQGCGQLPARTKRWQEAWIQVVGELPQLASYASVLSFLGKRENFGDSKLLFPSLKRSYDMEGLSVKDQQWPLS